MIDDSVITTREKAAIPDDQSLKVLQIQVETLKGDWAGAGEVAGGVEAVTSGYNELLVESENNRAVGGTHRQGGRSR